ncbi:MCE family protein [Rhodococcus sp. USK13]|uniref:MCE family protein n=1 Tax=Rhodococcus sp. USK13 TaxID=2806442 RepID=UPI001BCC5CB3|nr:MCE family protein [Rhodococcus sp. USK13]
MKPFAEMNPVRIGVIGLVVVAAIVLVSQNFDRIPLLTAGNVYSAYFADTGGLKEGDKVEVAGVQVGKVRGIELDEDKVLVEFDAKGIDLGSDSTLAVKTQTVLGNKSLQLSPQGSRRLGRGQIIPVSQTTTPYMLTDSLGDLTTTISGLDTEDLTSALDTLSGVFDQTEPNVAAALDGVSRFSSSIATRDEMIKDLFGNAEQVTSVLAKRSDQINKLLVDGNTLLGALDQRRQQIDTLLGRISAVTQEIRGLIADNQSQLRPTLDKLNQVLELLDKRKQELSSSIKPLGQYALSVGEAVSGGPFFKAYVVNLLPGQYLQPFIDAAFKDKGVDLGVLGRSTFPTTCGDNTPPGTVPSGHTDAVPNPSNCPVQPGQLPGSPIATPPPQPALQLPGLPALPAIPGIPGLGG